MKRFERCRTVPKSALFAVLASLCLAPAGWAEIFYRDTIHNASGGEIKRPKKIVSVILVDRTIDSGALCAYINSDNNTNARVRLTVFVDREDGTRFKHSRRVRLEEGEFQDCPMFAQTFEPGDRVTFLWKLGSLPKQIAAGRFLTTSSSIAALEPEFFEAQAAELMEMAMESGAKQEIIGVDAAPATLRTHFSHSSFYHADEADDFPDRLFNSLVIEDRLQASELCARFMTYESVPEGRIVARFEVLRDGEVVLKARGSGALEARQSPVENVPLTGSFRVCPASFDLEPGDVVFGRLDLDGLAAKETDAWFHGVVSASNGLSVF